MPTTPSRHSDGLHREMLTNAKSRPFESFIRQTIACSYLKRTDESFCGHLNKVAGRTYRYRACGYQTHSGDDSHQRFDPLHHEMGHMQTGFPFDQARVINV